MSVLYDLFYYSTKDEQENAKLALMLGLVDGDILGGVCSPV